MTDERPLTADDLRRKARDGTPVLWPGMAVGRVIRVARDGTWADMEWGRSRLDFDSGDAWRKRQPLTRLADWRHG